MQKYIFPVCLCLLFLLAFVWLVFPQASSARMPASIKYKDTGSEAPVWFSHARHLSSGKFCSDCHTKIFQKRKGHADAKNGMTMKAFEEGKYCGTCHNDGKEAFTVTENCDRCHSK